MLDEFIAAVIRVKNKIATIDAINLIIFVKIIATLLNKPQLIAAFIFVEATNFSFTK